MSFKNNSEFIENPWLPTNPAGWHWENWVFAARLILPYVANTAFVAGCGTIGSIGLALLGAYFFARYKMPFSRVSRSESRF